MIFWSLVIILLALFKIVQDLDLVGSMGVMPYQISTWLTLLIALGMLTRIRYMQNRGEKEELKNLLEISEKEVQESREDASRLRREIETIQASLAPKE